MSLRLRMTAVTLSLSLAWTWAWLQLLRPEFATAGDTAGTVAAGATRLIGMPATAASRPDAVAALVGRIAEVWVALNAALASAAAVFLTTMIAFRGLTFEHVRAHEQLAYLAALLTVLGVGAVPMYVEELRPLAAEFAPIVTWVMLAASYAAKIVNVDGPQPDPPVDMLGRIVVVTGSNSGIGIETAKRIAAKGATVIMACRTAETAAAAREAIVRETGNEGVTVMPLDLSSFKSVRGFAADFSKRYARLDVLVNNAGAMTPSRRVTDDGHEFMLQANFLGPALLTLLLFPKMRESDMPGGARVVNVSSSTARYPGNFDFDDQRAELSFSLFTRYGMSKLALNMFTVAFAERATAHNVGAFALNPGTVRTGVRFSLLPATERQRRARRPGLTRQADYAGVSPLPPHWPKPHLRAQ